MTKQSPNIIDVIRFLRSARNDYNSHFSEVSNHKLPGLGLTKSRFCRYMNELD
jgi:hypothetical protein